MRFTYFLIFLLSCSLLASAQDECSATFTVDCKKTPTSAYIAYPTRTICNLPDFDENSVLIQTNIYGSRTDKRTTATGFYYAKQIDDRWWIVDPEGYLSICRAVNAISKGTGTTSTQQYTAKYGNTTTWMNKTKQLLFENGFYCAGAWSSTTDIKSNSNQVNQPLAYTIILNWMSGFGSTRTYQQSGHMGYPNDAIFVFESGFAAYCESKAQALASNKTDKNIFGYFTDNELPFYNNSLNKFLRLGKTSTSDENYLATLNWLSDNGYTAADTVNSDIQKKFLGFVAYTYFSTVYNAIKKYDPNHMVLGPRVNIAEARENQYFMQAAGQYVDILAVNYYSVWSPNVPANINWSKNLGKPFMVTEFYTKGEDSGLANTSGAGWVVKTQYDRGLAYQAYTLGLLESKCCVGWHWFKYMDNDPTLTNVDPSNTNGNKGIVKIDYEPYTPLLEKMKELNERVYNVIDYFDQPKTVTKLYPEADAYYKGAENHGTDEQLGVKLTTDPNTLREAFLRFDLSGINLAVTSAVLKLFNVRTGDANVTYKAEFVADDSWTESSITISNHPSGVYELSQWSNNGNVTLDMTSVFLNSLNGDKKLSIKISGVTSTVSQLEYGSRENSDENLRPYIELTENISAVNKTKIPESNFKITPNPVRKNLSICIQLPESLTVKSRFTITDLNGKMLLNTFLSTSNPTLNITGLSAGIYLLTLSNSTDFSTQKLVVI
ncbi:MAG: T9SS type A sorting domain-containing protein [Paludibacter sp.]